MEWLYLLHDFLADAFVSYVDFVSDTVQYVRNLNIISTYDGAIFIHRFLIIFDFSYIFCWFFFFVF